MGNSSIENSEKEKYVGDIVHENGCEASITETIKERIRKLTSKCHDIIQTCENPLMGGLGNSLPPFKLFNATVAESLLTNCPSWIGLNESHINLLQNFQDGFIRNALHLANSIPKALLTWDIGLMPMKWRIAQKKLIFLNNLMKRDISNLAKQVIYEEVITGTRGLAYECSQLCEEIGIQDIMCFDTTEQIIKDAIWQKMNEEALQEMQGKKKVRDRLTENPEDNSYINTMSLPDTRIWIRYRGRAITGVKGNFKNSHTNDMSCRFCPRVPNETIEVPEETQEHIEICEGTQNERRGLDMLSWQGILKFWKRMSTRLSNMSTKQRNKKS